MFDAAFPALCFIGAFLCLLPLPWHWRARNTGVSILVGWTFSGCVAFGINSIVWAGNVEDRAPVWCDISSRLVVCLSVGLPASSLCVQRRLYRIAVVQKSPVARDLAKKQMLFDLCIGVGLPLMCLPLYYVTQPVRYNIIEDIGCWPALEWMRPSPVLFIVPVLISCISFAYAYHTLRAFLSRRQLFSEVLDESGMDLNLSRFFRLMALAGCDMTFSLPLSLYFLIWNWVSYDFEPWVSWNETHKSMQAVLTTTQDDPWLSPGWQRTFQLELWALPVCAFIFFMFFGLSSEAIEYYKRASCKILTLFGFRPSISGVLGSTISRRSPRLATGTTQRVASLPPKVTIDVDEDRSGVDIDVERDHELDERFVVVDVEDLEAQT